MQKHNRASIFSLTFTEAQCCIIRYSNAENSLHNVTLYHKYYNVQCNVSNVLYFWWTLL